MKTCPTCGQSMPVERLGVAMSPFKAKIFDAIQGSGKTGIPSDELYNSIFKPRSRNCMKAHIWQINAMIASHRIINTSNEKLSGRFYKLVKL